MHKRQPTPSRGVNASANPGDLVLQPPEFQFLSSASHPELKESEQGSALDYVFCAKLPNEVIDMLRRCKGRGVVCDLHHQDKSTCLKLSIAGCPDQILKVHLDSAAGGGVGSSQINVSSGLPTSNVQEIIERDNKIVMTRGINIGRLIREQELSQDLSRMVKQQTEELERQHHARELVRLDSLPGGKKPKPSGLPATSVFIAGRTALSTVSKPSRASIMVAKHDISDLFVSNNAAKARAEVAKQVLGNLTTSAGSTSGHHVASAKTTEKISPPRASAFSQRLANPYGGSGAMTNKAPTSMGFGSQPFGVSSVPAKRKSIFEEKGNESGDSQPSKIAAHQDHTEDGDSPYNPVSPSAGKMEDQEDDNKPHNRQPIVQKEALREIDHQDTVPRSPQISPAQKSAQNLHTSESPEIKRITKSEPPLEVHHSQESPEIKHIPKSTQVKPEALESPTVVFKPKPLPPSQANTEHSLDGSDSPPKLKLKPADQTAPIREVPTVMNPWLSSKTVPTETVKPSAAPAPVNIPGLKLSNIEESLYQQIRSKTAPRQDVRISDFSTCLDELAYYERLQVLFLKIAPMVDEIRNQFLALESERKDDSSDSQQLAQELNAKIVALHKMWKTRYLELSHVYEISCQELLDIQSQVDAFVQERIH